MALEASFRVSFSRKCSISLISRELESARLDNLVLLTVTAFETWHRVSLVPVLNRLVLSIGDVLRGSAVLDLGLQDRAELQLV